MEMSKTITNKDLIVLVTVMQRVIKDGNDTPLKEVLKSELKKLAPLIDVYNERVTDLKIDHCAIDPASKVILRDDKGEMQFTKEGQKAFGTSVKKLLEEPVVITQRKFTIAAEMVDNNLDIIEVLSDLLV